MGLTEKRVRDAKGGDKTRIEWDDRVKGLGLRITAKGVKAFILDYRVHGSKRRMTLGRAGDAGISLEAARENARAAKDMVSKGRDPLQELQDIRSLPTVTEALAKFDVDHLQHKAALGKISDSTIGAYRRQIERIIKPKLGKQRVENVTKNDVEEMVSDLKPIMRNRVLALTSSFFRRCEDWQLRPQNSNPARGIERATEEARDRTFSADELARLSDALEDVNEWCALAIRLAALTGLRIGEVRTIRWDNVDLESGALILPKTKTGRRVHTLPRSAVDLLNNAKRVGQYVIAGRDADKPMHDRTVSKAFEKACEAAGIEGATLHDLRRTAMTLAAGTGANSHLLRDMVGHKTTAMADRYVRQAGEPVIELREAVASTVADYMAGGRNDE